jgi:ATP-dependent Clp protease protease subunit
MRALILCLVATAGAVLSGCVYTPDPWLRPERATADLKVDFNDPLLNHRQIMLFGPIDQQTAELTIQKLLYLDKRGTDPIDLFLQTPGGEMKHAMAVEEVMRLIRCPVNTYALSECNSGGSLLLAAGTGKRRAFRGGLIVVHGLRIHGKPPPEYTEHLQDTYTKFWRKRTRLPEDWLPLPPQPNHVLTAEKALEYGLVDEIVD